VDPDAARHPPRVTARSGRSLPEPAARSLRSGSRRRLPRGVGLGPLDRFVRAGLEHGDAGIEYVVAAHDAQISGRASNRYRDRMPISLGPNAADARQAASLFRVLANPTRLAILLTLQTGEQRITDLTAQLGGSQANISAHLTRLKQAGLITSRTQGRAVYYRLTRPELGALLQAAAQLPAPAQGASHRRKGQNREKTQPTNQ